jgi:hypothetical protein
MKVLKFQRHMATMCPSSDEAKVVDTRSESNHAGFGISRNDGDDMNGHTSGLLLSIPYSSSQAVSSTEVVSLLSSSSSESETLDVSEPFSFPPRSVTTTITKTAFPHEEEDSKFRSLKRPAKSENSWKSGIPLATNDKVDGDEPCSVEIDRDVHFSFYHTIAKISNAKLDGKGTLDFSPDEIVNQSSLSSEMLLAYVQSNSVFSLSSSLLSLSHIPAPLWPANIKQQYFSGCSFDTRGNSSLTNESIMDVDISATIDLITLEQISGSFRLYSDVDVLSHIRYVSLAAYIFYRLYI